MKLTNRNLIIVAGGLFTLLAVLVVVFAYQQHWFGLNLSPEEKFISKYQKAANEPNPLLTDLAQQKFSITYAVEDVRAALPLLDACSAYIDRDPNLKQGLRTNAAIEVLTLADELTKGLIEGGVENAFGGNNFNLAQAITPYADYFTGSFLYFIHPTNMTKKTANDYIQKYSSTKPMKYLEGELKNNKDPNKKAVLYLCMSLDLHLGALGIDSMSKSISKDLISLTSRTNVSNYLDLLEQF